jgi:hypothetical protein
VCSVNAGVSASAFSFLFDSDKLWVETNLLPRRGGDPGFIFSIAARATNCRQCGVTSMTLFAVVQTGTLIFRSMAADI